MSGPAFKPTYSFLLVTLLVHSIALSQTNVRPHVNSSRALTPAAITVPFLPPVSYDLSSRAESVGAVDLNGDGILDIAVGSADGVNVLLGAGDGTFSSSTILNTGGIFVRLAVADVNGDGKPDLLAANACSWTDGPCAHGLLGVLLGNGNGSFQTAVTYDAGGSTSQAIAVADFNHDGKLDVVIALCGSSEDPCSRGTGLGSLVSVLLGNGDGTFRPAATYPSGGYDARSVAVADINHDGKADIVVANICAGPCFFNGEGNFGVLLGNGDGTFQDVVTHDDGGNDAFSVAIADLNKDGKPDVVATNCATISGGSCDTAQTGVFLGNGDGTFQPVKQYALTGDYNYALAVADINGDGKLDVADVTLSGFVNLLFGNGDGTFQPATTYAYGGGARSIAIADLNADGRPDLLIGGFDSSAVQVALNNSGPHAPTTTSLISNANPVLVWKPVTYTATVTTGSGRAAQGTIVFKDGSTTVATVLLDASHATFSAKYSKIGSHTISATYSGDTENAGSTKSLTQFVQGGTTTTVTTSRSPSPVTQSVTFTATVKSQYGNVPDGEIVTFYDAKKVLGTRTLTGGIARFTTSSLAAGIHTINAIYVGDQMLKTSTGSVKQDVQGFTTTTALSATPNPSSLGQQIAFTMHITSAGTSVPTGRVKLLDGATAIATVTLTSGAAIFKTATLVSGNHSMTAQYLGDALNAPSTSTVLVQRVNP